MFSLTRYMSSFYKANAPVCMCDNNHLMQGILITYCVLSSLSLSLSLLANTSIPITQQERSKEQAMKKKITFVLCRLAVILYIWPEYIPPTFFASQLGNVKVAY